MGPPKKLQSGIICILQRILANREKQVLRNMSDKRESFVKTEGKTIIFGKIVITCILAHLCLRFGRLFAPKWGSLGDTFFVLSCLFRGLFFYTFSKPLFGRPGSQKSSFRDPRGVEIRALACTPCYILENRHFHEKYLPGGGGVFFGSLLGVLFGHFSVFLQLRFLSHFRDPRGDRK